MKKRELEISLLSRNSSKPLIFPYFFPSKITSFLFVISTFSTFSSNGLPMKCLEDESMNFFVKPSCRLSDNSFSIICVFSCQ